MTKQSDSNNVQVDGLYISYYPNDDGGFSLSTCRPDKFQEEIVDMTQIIELANRAVELICSIRTPHDIESPI